MWMVKGYNRASNHSWLLEVIFVSHVVKNEAHCDIVYGRL